MASRVKEMPHPLLSGRSPDYAAGCHFLAEPDVMRRTGSGSIAIVLDYTVSAPSIVSLIDSEKAMFCTVVECDSTKTREAFVSDEFRHPVTLDSSIYTGAVKIRPHITATEHIEGFYSDDWRADIKEMLPNGISLPTGAILGRAVVIDFDAGGLISGESFFEIAPAAHIEKGLYSIDIEGERITIQVCPDDLPPINSLRNMDDRETAPIWMGMYQRAVEEGVRRHRDEEHVKKRWAHNIGKQLGDAGMETYDADVLEARTLEYAQRLMQNPLNRITAVASEVDDLE